MRKSRKEYLKKYRRTKKGLLTNMYSNLKARSILYGFGEVTFSKKEFDDFVLSFSEYHTFYEGWVESNYNKNLVPSIDRIDPDKPYLFENMQILRWFENDIKGHKESSRRTTTVLMFNMNDEIICEFESLKEAKEKTGIHNIGAVCRGERFQAGGYKFKYKGDKFRVKKEKLSKLNL